VARLKGNDGYYNGFNKIREGSDEMPLRTARFTERKSENLKRSEEG
jgi:hypothetical protein